jgi:hypothetical protein
LQRHPHVHCVYRVVDCRPITRGGSARHPTSFYR